MEAVRHEDYSVGLNLSRQLLSEDPHCKAVLIVAVQSLWRLKKFKEAITLSKQALDDHPRSEVLSLIYFQVLMETDKVGEAKNEMRRLLKLRDSETYRLIMGDLNWTDEK